MAQFLMLLHEAPTDPSSFSPEEMQQMLGEYVAWREQIEGEGRLAGANKLADEGGRVLTADNGQVRVVDGPFSEAKEVIGGYFLIEADDYDGAVEVSKGCPHLKYNGRIEVRRVDEVEGH